MRLEWSLSALVATALWVNAIPAAAATIEITISDLAFAPADVSAHVGDKLTWINNDPFLHSATAKGHWDIDIQPEERATLTLKKPGTFDYICRYHPNMTGRITVTDH